MTKQAILETLQQCRPEVQARFHAQIKGIFGSQARGDSTSRSDLDVLVDFGPEADLFDFVGLCGFLEETFKCPVDLVPISSIREEIKDQVLAQAVYI